MAAGDQADSQIGYLRLQKSTDHHKYASAYNFRTQKGCLSQNLTARNALVVSLTASYARCAGFEP
jgi:hypothetical protein